MIKINLEDQFNELDSALQTLALSDSAIEYASHIRPEFSNVLDKINRLKYETGNGRLMKNSDWYFDKED